MEPVLRFSRNLVCMYVMSSYGWDTHLRVISCMASFCMTVKVFKLRCTRVNEMAVTKAVNVIRNQISVSLFVIKCTFT